MPLPIIETPKYEITIPSTGKKVVIRPYLVKEEKILMIAMESEDQQQIINAVKEMIVNCSFRKIDPDKLCLFDLEYLFLQLRAKSVGEIAKIGIKCEKCGEPTDVSVNLAEIVVDMSNIPDNKIKLTETIGVIMGWPKVKNVANAKMGPKDSILAAAIDVVISSIEAIYDDKKIHQTSEVPKAEVVAFVENLNQTQFAKIQDYLSAMPRVTKSIEFKCLAKIKPGGGPGPIDDAVESRICGHENKLVLSGMQSFFASA